MVGFIMKTFLDGLETWIQQLLRQGYTTEKIVSVVTTKLEEYFIFGEKAIDRGELISIIHKVMNQMTHLVIVNFF